MKKLIAIYLFPLVIAAITIFLLATKPSTNDFLFPKKESNSESKIVPRIIDNYIGKEYLADNFLMSCDTAETIYVLGSSELTHVTEAIPYNFISKHFKTQVIGVGHAGNQSLSMYAQLLANEQRLPNAPIVIIVSPGWFESKSSAGTSSEVFLEYNIEMFLTTILKDKNNAAFTEYLYKRVAQLYDDFGSPSVELRLMNFKNHASKSMLHKIVYAPLICFDNALLGLKETIMPKIKRDVYASKRCTIIPEPIAMNWDSLNQASKAEILSKATNNQMGINDEYFTQNIHSNKGGHIEAVGENNNQELKDFKMLLMLLKAKKVNARLIVSPLNALYYRNLEAILPTMQLVENEIQQSGFPCLNLFAKDKTTYDKALLSDVMHISDYGWYKIDRFIVETYKLAK